MKHIGKIDGRVFLFVAAIIVSGIVFAGRNGKNPQFTQRGVPLVEKSASYEAVDTATRVPQTETSSQSSPDGKKILVLTTTHNSDGTLTHVFTTTDGDGGNKYDVYTATVPVAEEMSIPFNTWSPDDKYLFVLKHDGDALVFRATGEEIVEGQLYLDVGDLFSASNKKDAYHETTGWASPTLLIVNTVREDGTKGSSYWFEVPSKAIIQLSSQF